jgi:hypothetical protein
MERLRSIRADRKKIHKTLVMSPHMFSPSLFRSIARPFQTARSRVGNSWSWRMYPRVAACLATAAAVIGGIVLAATSRGWLLPTLLFAMALAVPLLFWIDHSSRRSRDEQLDCLLGERLKNGFDRLRDAGIDRYRQPFFLMIGELKAGKTTSIREAGLGLAGGSVLDVGKGGGTIGCNWWLTDHATIIDAAGHYTTTSWGADADGEDPDADAAQVVDEH